MTDDFDLQAAFASAAKLLGKESFPIVAKFKPYAGLRGNIAMEGGTIYAKISDGYKAAELPALTGLAVDLMSKLFRMQNMDERAYVYLQEFQKLNGKGVYELHETLRSQRGRKRRQNHIGIVFDLNDMLNKVVSNYPDMFSEVDLPTIVWSRNHSRRRLAFYDGAFNQIVVSRKFDSEKYPQFLLEYLIYHELLHAKHAVKYGKRRKVHHRDFHLDEKQFVNYEEAEKLLKNLH